MEIQRNRIPVLAALVGLVAALAMGCTTVKRAQMAQEARSDMLGMTRGALMKCAGEPAHRMMLGDRELLTYLSDKEPHPRHTCVGTFVLRRDQIERLDFSTPSGRLPESWEKCAPIVENCLS